MILVDTSVLIGFLRGSGGKKVDLFRQAIEREFPFGISALTYQEILQGAKDEKELALLEQYLGALKIYHLPQSTEFYTKASRLYYTLRRKGLTVRGTIDVLIAATAIANDLYLLHDDRDFDVMAGHIPELHVLNEMPE